MLQGSCTYSRAVSGAVVVADGGVAGNARATGVAFACVHDAVNARELCGNRKKNQVVSLVINSFLV